MQRGKHLSPSLICCASARQCSSLLIAWHGRGVVGTGSRNSQTESSHGKNEGRSLLYCCVIAQRKLRTVCGVYFPGPTPDMEQLFEHDPIHCSMLYTNVRILEYMYIYKTIINTCIYQDHSKQ